MRPVANGDVAHAVAVVVDDARAFQHEIESLDHSRPPQACFRLAVRIRKTDARCNRSGETMADTRIALLPDRGIVSVTGEDAAKLLQGVVTNDMGLLESAAGAARRAADPAGQDPVRLLRRSHSRRLPARDGARQGARRSPTGSCSTSCAPRPTSAMSRPTIRSPRSGAARTSRTAHGKAPLLFADSRLPALGSREFVTIGSDWALANDEADSATQDEYHAHRIGLGVPEGGKDYAFGDTFPHEALFDQLAGVSFTKGCYVGQEVVARMQNRGTTRKRIVPVVGTSALPAPGAAYRCRRRRDRHARLDRGDMGLRSFASTASRSSCEGRSLARRRCSGSHRAARAGPRSRSPRRLRRREPRPHELKVARRSRPLPVGRRRHRVPPLSRRRMGRAAD